MERKKMAEYTTAIDTIRAAPKLIRSAVYSPGLTDSHVARAAAAFERLASLPGTSCGSCHTMGRGGGGWMVVVGDPEVFGGLSALGGEVVAIRRLGAAVRPPLRPLVVFSLTL